VKFWHRNGRRHGQPSPPAKASVKRAVLQFALSGTAAVALLGVVAVQVLLSSARDAGIRNAKDETRLVGDGIVAPSLSDGLLTRQPQAIKALDQIVHRRALRNPVVRVKIWDASGQILYSDAHQLIGLRYPLPAAELQALRTGSEDAEISDLSRPENRFERSQHKLLEVYLGIRAPNGTRLLYEDYLQYNLVAATGNRLWGSLAPPLIAILVALELAQIPLAWSLARRLRRGQNEREALLHRAIDASQVERQRVARDLHDSVVQNLAGVSYTLSAAADRLDGDSEAQASEMIRQAAAQTRRSIRELRTLLVDIYPPTLQRAGLNAALSDLVAPLSARDIDVKFELADDLGIAPERERVLYRAAQEAVRNVATHAEASHVRIYARRENGHALLGIEDDGRGFQHRATGNGQASGHFGLRMLDDLVREAGGTLEVQSAPGAGTRIAIEIPAS
jgi:two-component system, NarL family, sensor kinase